MAFTVISLPYTCMDHISHLREVGYVDLTLSYHTKVFIYT